MSKKYRAVVIENDPCVLQMLQRYFAHHKEEFDVEFCISCDEMIALLAKNTDESVNLFLIDAMLSNPTNGIMISASLRQQFPYSIVIVMTGYEKAYPFERARMDGHCDDYITKPFYLRELDVLIEHHMYTIKRWKEMQK